MEDRQIIIDNIKWQAEAFLLDANEFHPFGAYISNNREIVPVGAFIEDENDNPPSLEMIELLEKSFKQRLETEVAIIAAIAIDVSMKENGKTQDAIEIRLLEKDRRNTIYIKYHVEDGVVEFY